MNDYNRVVLCGEVKYGPTLVNLGDVEKKPHTKLMLSVKRGNRQSSNRNYFDVRGYGDIGTDMYQNIKNGDRIIVEGPVSAYAYKGKDNTLKAISIVYAFKWMHDPVSSAVKAAEEAAMGNKQNKPTSEGYGDNAEMLF